MEKSIFQRLAEEQHNRKLIPHSKAATKWLLDRAEELKNLRPNLLMRQANQTAARFEIGRLYFFYYSPKTKEKLPYWDQFPLVIPIEQHKDGFLSINLHYLPPKLRILLLDRLTDFANNTKYDNKTKLQLSYGLLKGVKRYKLFEPCLKKHLFDFIQSKIIPIPAEEWHMAVVLPLARFKKEKEVKVWKDSEEKIAQNVAKQIGRLTQPAIGNPNA